MEVVIYLIPIAITMGALGLACFIWSVRSGQLDDMDGAAMRALQNDDGTISTDGEVSSKSSQ